LEGDSKVKSATKKSKTSEFDVIMERLHALEGKMSALEYSTRPLSDRLFDSELFCFALGISLLTLIGLGIVQTCQILAWAFQ
jgi:hypothetical protein